MKNEPVSSSVPISVRAHYLPLFTSHLAVHPVAAAAPQRRLWGLPAPLLPRPAENAAPPREQELRGMGFEPAGLPCIRAGPPCGSGISQDSPPPVLGAVLWDGRGWFPALSRPQRPDPAVPSSLGPGWLLCIQSWISVWGWNPSRGWETLPALG